MSDGIGNATALILANFVKAKAKTNPDRDVLTFVSINSDGDFVDECRTYQQLWENGQRLAAYLLNIGLKKGDKFAVVMQNHPEFVDLMVASSIVGTVFVPIDPRTRGAKLEYMLNFAECKGAFVANYAYDSVKEVWGEGSKNWIVPLNDDGGSAESVEKISQTENSRPIEIQSDNPLDPMQLLYTSGTTGDPKGIISSHARFSIAASLGAVLGLTEEDRPYTGLSLTHANAQVITLGSIIYLGMRGVISRKFTKSRLWDITREYGCTFFNLLGGMTTAIYAEPKKENDADNPVKRILSAGMPAAIWQEFEARFDVELYEFYGAAEGGLTFNPPGGGPIGSCGKPAPGLDIALFNENGKECAVDEPGEICFRNADGSSPVVEYFKNAEASSQKTEGGWLRMGDIGHLDKNGWLFFHFRKNGGIRRNGDFVNTAFVEKYLAEIDGIEDVFVYGVPTKTGVPGEKDVVAAVVTDLAEGVDVQNLYHQCEKNLDANSVPTYFQFVPDIPKTASEKPQERFLVDLFENSKETVFTKESLTNISWSKCKEFS